MIKRDFILNSRIQYGIKNILGSLHFVQKPLKRPITIFSARRSGSTLLAEVLGTEPGVNVSDQPFDLWHYNPHAKKLPKPYLSKFIVLSKEDETQFRNYVQDLFSGKIRVYTRWNFLDSDYSFVVNRMVFKILSAKSLIDWFDENFEVDIIYQIRHPIPYALSVIKLNWGCTADAFLKNETFVERYLSPHKLDVCQKILTNGTLLQKHVLEWGLENAYPLAVFEKREWLTLSYEELIMRPKQSCQLLAERLNLSDQDKMVQHVARPSVNAKGNSNLYIEQGNTELLLKRWMKQIDPGEAQSAMEILQEVLNIQVYKWDDPFPSKELCQFGAFS